ncbi:flagellar basal body-associated protein FliL [Bacillus thermophilus]|uniref:Flagellar basal body-associated protein FliL n=1 Tax=Siminovitchia thermophila TaxID=1245522 RepID=A0ABS2RB50_9BACI|nr:hypothetical protein [Siminovitchia thermophila]MBM7716890.1 flagellar basal body-associated protein FliL [Siminovitchia thermophila]
MKRSVLIWLVTGIVYLGAVIAGYSLYANMNSNTDEPANHGAMQTEENMNH